MVTFPSTRVSPLDAAPWLVLVSWFVYVAQWRPCLRVDGNGFELINGLSDHQIPFDTVEDIEVRYARAAGLRSSDGRVTTTWNRPMIAVGVVVLLWVIAAVLL